MPVISLIDSNSSASSASVRVHRMADTAGRQRVGGVRLGAVMVERRKHGTPRHSTGLEAHPLGSRTGVTAWHCCCAPLRHVCGPPLCTYGPCRGAGDNAGQEVGLQQGLDDAHVERAEGAAARQHQRGAAKGVAGLAQEGNLVLQRHVWGVGVVGRGAWLLSGVLLAQGRRDRGRTSCKLPMSTKASSNSDVAGVGA